MNDEIDIEDLIVRAAIFLKKYKYAESIKTAFEAAVAMSQDDPRHERLQRTLFSAAEQSPGSLTTLKTLGRYYVLRGQYDDALSSFQTGLRLCKSDKSRSEFAVECGSLLSSRVNEGRFGNEAEKNRMLGEAENYFLSALDYGADRAGVYSSLMYLSVLKNDVRNALIYAQKIVDVAGPNDLRAVQARKLLLEESDFNRPDQLDLRHLH